MLSDDEPSISVSEAITRKSKKVIKILISVWIKILLTCNHKEPSINGVTPVQKGGRGYKKIAILGDSQGLTGMPKRGMIEKLAN